MWLSRSACPRSEIAVAGRNGVGRMLADQQDGRLPRRVFDPRDRFQDLGGPGGVSDLTCLRHAILHLLSVVWVALNVRYVTSCFSYFGIFDTAFHIRQGWLWTEPV